MKRLSLIVAALFTLTMYGPAYAQTSQANSNTQVAAPRGKALVKRLPRGVEGVVLKGNTVKLKSGYQFVNQPDGTIAVGLKNSGGRGVGGTWDCLCGPTTPTGGPASGGCRASISGTSLVCTSSTCTGSCSLHITVGGLKTAVIRY